MDKAAIEAELTNVKRMIRDNMIFSELKGLHDKKLELEKQLKGDKKVSYKRTEVHCVLVNDLMNNIHDQIAPRLAELDIEFMQNSTHISNHLGISKDTYYKIIRRNRTMSLPKLIEVVEKLGLTIEIHIKPKTQEQVNDYV